MTMSQTQQINPYELSSTWTVFNPTPKTVEAMFNGHEIIIRPFSSFETAHKVVHDHLVNSINFKNRGLVSYTFTDEMKRIYGNEKEFQKAMAINGLRSLETFFEQTIHFERVAEQANKIQKVPSFLKSKLDKFEKDYKEIQTLITKYLEKTDESRANQDESETKARRNSSKAVVE